MKVFIVILETYYEGFEIERAYSTLAAAWEFMDAFAEEFNKKQAKSNNNALYRKETDFFMEKGEDGYSNELEEITVSEFDLLN